MKIRQINSNHLHAQAIHELLQGSWNNVKEKPGQKWIELETLDSENSPLEKWEKTGKNESDV